MIFAGLALASVACKYEYNEYDEPVCQGDCDSTSGAQSFDLGGEVYNDKLLVEENRENPQVTIHFNQITFTARLNYENGLHYFNYDDGTIGGDQITCVVDIRDKSFEGDCYRQARVCHFDFTTSVGAPEGYLSYQLKTASCKDVGRGPFFVPLDAAQCGAAPFPPCVEEVDVFPQDPQAIDPEQADVRDKVDSLINEVCVTAQSCFVGLEVSECEEDMNGVEGPHLWQKLGVDQSTSQIRLSLSQENLSWNEANYTTCLESIKNNRSTCTMESSDPDSEDYFLSDVVPNQEACKQIFIRE